jgi:hypothetical protein
MLRFASSSLSSHYHTVTCAAASFEGGNLCAAQFRAVGTLFKSGGGGGL